jgi:elongation factor Ts
MAQNTETVQKLRELTGAGIMDCKRALDETNGDFDAAVKVIHERGMAKVEKRADRETGAGMVKSYVHNDRIGVMVELRAETDFVVRSEPFQNLAHEITMQLTAMPAQNVEELMEQEYIKDPSKKVSDLVKDVIGRVGENVRVNQFYRIEL